MPPPEDPDGPPEYRVHRSRKRWLSRRGGDDRDDLARLRGEPQRGEPPRGPRDGHGISGRGRRRGLRSGRWTWGRAVRWLAYAVLGWIALSVVVFLISAQIQQGKVRDDANQYLGGAGLPPFSANNILVLGSDQRSAGNAEPGSSTTSGRSDSIMLMRVGGGANSRLSIARDTVVDIPGAGRNKINAAFAIGGTALAIKTVEDYTGIDVNHVVLVSFENFPDLIDAMGGITYHGGCVVSLINGGRRNGGYTLRLKSGATHISGRQALALARTRKNRCAKNENDLTRAKRQQKIFTAMKSRLRSPAAFIRLPFISWAAPKTLRSDMSGPTLLGVFSALSVTGTPQTNVLGTLSGQVPEALKQRAVRRFLAG
jgi:LCP family protein required for cell wall assembly